jgi:hypothetical protein
MRLLTAASYVEAWEGKHQAAVAYLEEARALTTDLDGRRRAAFLSALATAYFSSGDVEAAVKAGMGLRFPVYGPLEHLDAVGLEQLCHGVLLGVRVNRTVSRASRRAWRCTPANSG